MNLLLFERHEVDGGHAVLGAPNDERLRHVRKVLKSNVGDALAAGVVDGSMGTGRITAIDRQRLAVELDLDSTPPPKHPIHLLVALPRPKMLGRILEHATALGVEAMTFVSTARTERSYWHSRVLESDSVARHVRLGLAQARDTVLPVVRFERERSQLGEIAAALARERQAFVAWEEATVICPSDVTESAAVLIGPEGGLLTPEVEQLESVGWEPISLGQRALRVEAAVTAALARLTLGAH